MQTQNGVKQIKLIVMIGVLAFATFGRFGQAALGSAAQEQPRRALELVPVSTPLEARVGLDDGALLAVQFLGNTRGTLDTCG